MCPGIEIGFATVVFGWSSDDRDDTPYAFVKRCGLLLFLACETTFRC